MRVVNLSFWGGYYGVAHDQMTVYYTLYTTLEPIPGTALSRGGAESTNGKHPRLDSPVGLR